jgi:hypothetical protein
MAPQLLSLKPPAYDWNDGDNLYLRFCYDFMPKGILTQFIVAMHEKIAEQRLMWKTGVVVEDPESHARAEVIEVYDQREVHIRVSGEGKKDLLVVVRHEMEKIHRTYPRLKYDTLIPCSCPLCKTAETPEFYPFTVLNRFFRERQASIQCRRSYQMVDVRELMGDMILPVSLKDERGPDEASLGQFHGATIGTVIVQPAGKIDFETVQTGGGAYIGGDVSVGGDFVGRDSTAVSFPQVYEMIEASRTIPADEKSRVKDCVKDVEEELEDGGETPNEGFLARRFKNIARIAPDIIDVMISAAANPAAGITSAAQKIAKRAAEAGRRGDTETR